MEIMIFILTFLVGAFAGGLAVAMTLIYLMSLEDRDDAKKHQEKTNLWFRQKIESAVKDEDEIRNIIHAHLR